VTATYLDGQLIRVLKDVDTSKLDGFQLPTPKSPTVIMLAQEHVHFKLSDANTSSPTQAAFLRPLDEIRAVLSTKSDFLVMLMSPALLHANAVSRLTETRLKVLTTRYDVHPKLLQVRDTELPQERIIPAANATPFSTALDWQAISKDEVGLGELRIDLFFQKYAR
jgi:hypothetical protein